MNTFRYLWAWIRTLLLMPFYIHEILELLKLLHAQQGEIVATQKEIVDQLNTLSTTLTSIGTEVDKIGTETGTLIQKITDLQNSLPADASPELVAAVQAVVDQATVVANKVKAVDDLVPDAPVTPPTPAP